MKAIVFTRYGLPEVLKFHEVDTHAYVEKQYEKGNAVIFPISFLKNNFKL